FPPVVRLRSDQVGGAAPELLEDAPVGGKPLQARELPAGLSDLLEESENPLMLADHRVNHMSRLQALLQALHVLAEEARVRTASGISHHSLFGRVMRSCVFVPREEETSTSASPRLERHHEHRQRDA